MEAVILTFPSRLRGHGEDVPAVIPAFHTPPEINRTADHIHDCRIRLRRPFRIFHTGYMGSPVERLAPHRMEIPDRHHVIPAAGLEEVRQRLLLDGLLFADSVVNDQNIRPAFRELCSKVPD